MKDIYKRMHRKAYSQYLVILQDRDFTHFINPVICMAFAAFDETFLIGPFLYN